MLCRTSLCVEHDHKGSSHRHNLQHLQTGVPRVLSDYNTALVTGASGGIGAGIVAWLASKGIKVHAVSRNSARLEELSAKTGCVPHVLDIRNTDALEELAELRDIDILVNNAGVSRAGDILSMDRLGVEEQVEVNIEAVLQLVRLSMPGMVARDRGHIVNVSSIAGIYNFAGNTVYHATKAALHMMSRQLRVAAYGKRVRVTEVCPGRVETEIFGKVIGDMARAQREFYDGYESLKVEDIVGAVAYALEAPRHVNIGHIEILPTFQVPGGLNFERRSD
ncbi:MAG: SDR family oxidoreductase [Telmatospirillum sp.]|nr:SDR family oxidoreductase [Telmatospirillum sp.]